MFSNFIHSYNTLTIFKIIILRTTGFISTTLILINNFLVFKELIKKIKWTYIFWTMGVLSFFSLQLLLLAWRYGTNGIFKPWYKISMSFLCSMMCKCVIVWTVVLAENSFWFSKNSQWWNTKVLFDIIEHCLLAFNILFCRYISFVFPCKRQPKMN